MNPNGNGQHVSQQPAGQVAPLSASLPAPIVETSASAAAAQAKALVEARYIMALRKPRVWLQVRQDILNECKRPAFAQNKSAFYRKPVGQGVEGLGIRFVEVALRCMTNVLVETPTVFEDAEKRILRVYVTDLESNTVYTKDVTVSKTVERSKVPDGVQAISKRKNSNDQWVFLIPATDDDLLNKEGALVSKAIRTLALRLIPGDIQDEAEELIKRVRLDRAAEDPAAEQKRIADAFAELNVKATDLHEFLGHALDSCSPKELVDLRGIYGAIRDGEATWASVMENKREQAGANGNGKKPPSEDALPALSDEEFNAKFAKWKVTIEAGKKTALDVVATALTKNTLTDDQRKKIEAVKAAGAA